MRRKWLVPAIWAVILIVSCVTQAYVTVADDARRGDITLFSRSFAIQATSHLVIAALIPVVYWMQRYFPFTRPRNFAAHAVALVAFSVAHTLGRGALRLLWFVGGLGDASFRCPIKKRYHEYQRCASPMLGSSSRARRKSFSAPE